MVDIDAAHKQKRYLDKTGKRDWIDKCANDMPMIEFNGAMFFTIGKYYQRLGKKDPEKMELAKIEDYKARWIGVLVSCYCRSKAMAKDFVDAEIKRARKLANE